MTTAETTRPALRRRTLLALAACVAALGGVACAPAYAAPNLVDLQVVDRETGQPLHVWRRHGRLYVAGRSAARYSLRVTNHTGGRVLVVMSVDGVNIVTGETAGVGQGGYVFAPYETFDINGWRKSTREIAAFTFAPLPKSYAARTGRPGDVGVIGLAAFRERAPEPPPPPPPEAYQDQPGDDDRSGSVVDARRAAPTSDEPLPAPPPPAMAPPPSPARAASAPVVVTAQRREEKLGTGHGARETSVIDMVDFERATAYPQTVLQVEYDSYDNLVAAGVIRPGEGHRPRPFPSGDGAGFVPDPPPGEDEP